MGGGAREMVIPANIEPVYGRLDYDLTRLWSWYRMLFDLYGESELRLRLLNEAAPAFFGELQTLLRNEIVLGVARLTDMPSRGSSKRLVLGSIVGALDETQTAEIGSELDAALTPIIETAAPIRRYRHEVLAHRNMAVALGSRDDPVQEFTYSDIRCVLDLAGGLLNVVAKKYLGHTVMYSGLIENLNGIPALVQRLKIAQHYRTAVFEDHEEFLKLKESEFWSA